MDGEGHDEGVGVGSPFERILEFVAEEVVVVLVLVLKLVLLLLVEVCEGLGDLVVDARTASATARGRAKGHHSRPRGSERR